MHISILYIYISLLYERIFNINIYIIFAGGAANFIGAIKPKYTPNINKMNYVLMTKNRNIPISLQKSSKLWKHPGFDNKLKVIILVTGWNSNLNSDENDDSSKTLNTIYNAYRCRDDYNFVVCVL